MRKYLGWMHIKDYTIDPSMKWTGVVDEERLKNFVPANRGDAGHELVLRDLREHLPKLERKMKKLGVPGTPDAHPAALSALTVPACWPLSRQFPNSLA